MTVSHLAREEFFQRNLAKLKRRRVPLVMRQHFDPDGVVSRTVREARWGQVREAGLV
jgi:hypothetical protein